MREEIVIQKEVLLKSLQFVLGAVEKKLTLPNLSHVLFSFDAKENHLTLQATDLEIELKSFIPAHQFQTQTQLSFTLPGRKLFDICKTLPDNTNISLIVAPNTVTVKSHHSTSKLPSFAAADFPCFSEMQTEQKLTLNKQLFSTLLEKTAFAIAQQDVRQYLNGLMISVFADKIQAAASDGHRLALAWIDHAPSNGTHEYQFILPKKTTQELLQLIKNSEEETLEIEINNRNIKISSQNWVMTSKLIEGQCPDIKKVIPTITDKNLVIDREALKAALARAIILTDDKNYAVQFHLSPNQLNITAENEAQEKIEEELSVDYPFDELTINFNVRYIIEILGLIRTPMVQWSLHDAKTGVIVEATEEQDSIKSIYLIMPMRI